MRKLTNLLVLLVFIGGLICSSNSVNASETTKDTENISVYEICNSTNTWEEYKEVVANFKYEKGENTIKRVFKMLPDSLEKITTFSSLGLFIPKDEEVEEFEKAFNHAISLYEDVSNLKITITKREHETGIHFSIDAEKPLTHIGNVVISAGIPYYSNIDNYRLKENKCYSQKCILSYTCGAAYYNPDGTLEKMDYIPFNVVANLKDSQKIEIDTSFEGTIIILLCTIDNVLGWTDLDGLYQYEDASGNMEFYNPELIKYY